MQNSRIKVFIVGVVSLFYSLLSVASSSLPTYVGSGFVTQGRATTIESNIFDCENGRSRVAGLGEIKDSHGQAWIVPGANHYHSATHATDLYEECANIKNNNIAELDLNSVPLVNIDADGEVISGYIFADNYFELYINGILVAVDSVPFTPFNASVVRFKVTKPYTIAVKLIDWEEHLGLGTENNRGKNYHPGDGGFIASFSDGTISNARWKAQTFYTAPIYDLSCLSEKNGVRLSSTCSIAGRNDGADAYAVHWKLPSDWYAEAFDASHWPQASTYSEDEIGVNNKKAYMNFIDKFSGAGAHFIWSSNVVLDNEVLLRYRVE